MRISHNPRDPRRVWRVLSRRALGIAACHDDPRRGILPVNCMDRLARLQIRRRRHCAGIHHHNVGATRVRRGGVSARKQLPLDRRRISLRLPGIRIVQ